MAGGKETPRQKMIGMMYLVLTALLALQVSNAVLEKFAIINETLNGLIVEGNKNSDLMLESIIKDAGESTSPNVVTARDNAKKVRDLTKSTLQAIDKLKADMMAASGTDKVDDRLINDHSSKVATMMIDVKSPVGKGYEKLLNDYVKQLNDLSKIDPPLALIAKAPKDIPIFAADKDHVRKDFLTFTFENTPVIAAIASVTQAETEVLDYEARVLDKLAKDAGANRISFDQFIPMVRAKSSTVAAGAKYEAEMFLTGSSTSLESEYFKDGAKLPIVEDGVSGVKMGKVEFTAQGGGYDANGIAKKSFKAEITVKGQTFAQNIEYFVAQPVIKVTTGNAPTLYMNCGNNVNIEVPSLGTNYNPTFGAGGNAEIIKGDKPGKVTIIPKQRKISVGVTNGGVKIGDANFDVKNVPAPRYIAYVGNTPVDLRNGIKANQIGSLRFVAEPDANFKEEVPKDARYRIKRAEVILGRGTAGVQRLNATNENPDLRAWSNQARPGDRIIIDIKDVVRRTYKDDEEKVPVTGSVGIISVPVQ
jgi:gliding motility-associated protein GldM